MATVDPKPARIVMLVDNRVDVDSRVQKTARSAAQTGWDVTLLGLSPDGKPKSWMLGSAKVRLMKMPSPLKARRHEFRRRWFVAPLAYPPTGIASVRAQTVRAWQADLAVRRALLARQQPSRGRTLRRQWLRAHSAACKITKRWVDFRGREQDRAKEYRATLRGPWDRAYTWFWLKARGVGAWRRLEPQLWDYELAYGPTIDKLKPDLIYANDFRMLGVGARAKIRAAAKGHTIRLIWDVHEYLPGVRPRADHARWTVGNYAHEREYAPYADGVITVSDRLAGMLRHDHHLAEMPSVVLNTPSWADVSAPRTADTPDIRTACGLGEDTPLVVYSGVASVQRGMDVMIEAMPVLAGVHVAFVVKVTGSPYVTGLVARAKALGVADRLHVLPYVEHSQVVAFLSSATAGVIPIHHWLNHEIQLITKFFEYSHARLPIIVSDVETMAAQVRENGQGEVFRAEDVADYARAVRAILEDPDRYRKAYDRIDLRAWTWEAQAAAQDRLYRALAPNDRQPPPALPHQPGSPAEPAAALS